jgi:hypothetical protein
LRATAATSQRCDVAAVARKRDAWKVLTTRPDSVTLCRSLITAASLAADTPTDPTTTIRRTGKAKNVRQVWLITLET